MRVGGFADQARSADILADQTIHIRKGSQDTAVQPHKCRQDTDALNPCVDGGASVDRRAGIPGGGFVTLSVARGQQRPGHQPITQAELFNAISVLSQNSTPTPTTPLGSLQFATKLTRRRALKTPSNENHPPCGEAFGADGQLGPLSPRGHLPKRSGGVDARITLSTFRALFRRIPHALVRHHRPRGAIARLRV